MCNAAGIEPIVTTSAESNTLGRAPSVKGPATCCDPEDMADLVESAPGNISLDPVTFLIHRLILWSRYCWGDPRNTTWGRQRAADGHPHPYRLKWIELGNEQYNSRFVEQVAAMEARASKLGMPRTLHYLFP